MSGDEMYEDRIAELRVPFVIPDDPTEREMVCVALALAGESGELANKVKKLCLKGGTSRSDVSVDDLIEELGDIQAYSAMLARLLKIRLSEVRAKNIEKLVRRKKERS